MDSTALNYDPMATIQGVGDPLPGLSLSTGRCYYLSLGCLNPSAVNYGCQSRQDASCASLAPCTSAPSTDSSTPRAACQATIHVAFLCKYPGEPSEGTASPPPPPPPGGVQGVPGGGGYSVTTSYLVSFSMAAAGSLTENLAIRGQVMANYVQTLATQSSTTVACEDLRAYLKPAVGDEVGPYAFTDPPACVNAELVATAAAANAGRQLQSSASSDGGGVTWRLEIVLSDPAARDAAVAALDQYTASGGATTADVAALFGNIPGFNAYPGNVATQEVYTYTRSGLTDAQLAGVIAGVVIGVVLMLVAIALFMRQKKKKAYAKTVVPA